MESTIKESPKKIYDMKLNDVYRIGIYTIVRVPTGWIYNNRELKTSTFVPHAL